MNFQHEAVELGFGELVGALLIDRVLGRQDQKRVRQFEGLIADGHLAFLHRLQQGALDLGGRAVDFVGKNQVRENRAEFRGELALAGVVDQRADQIRRKKIGRELEPLEPRLDRARKRPHRQRLGKSRNAFEQHVAIGQKTHQQPVHQIFLPHHDLAHFRKKRVNPLTVFLDLMGEFGGIDAHNLCFTL